MDKRSWTISILIAAVAVVIGWDVFVAATPPDGDTVSEIVLSFSTRNPVLAFAVGFIGGHLFWPQRMKG